MTLRDRTIHLLIQCEKYAHFAAYDGGACGDEETQREAEVIRQARLDEEKRHDPRRA